MKDVVSVALIFNLGVTCSYTVQNPVNMRYLGNSGKMEIPV